MIYVYLVYGLSFFILWTVLWIYHIKIGETPLARNLWMIAGFAVCHGVGDWIATISLIGRLESVTFRIISLVLLAISFVFLVQFGISTMPALRGKLLKGLPLILTATVVAATLLSKDIFLSGEIFSRYFLGIPGMVLTFIALRRETEKAAYPGVARYLRFASIAFIFYGLFAGLVVPKANFFPASFINYESLQALTHMRVELFRALCILYITYALSRVLHTYELETEKRMRMTKEELEFLVAERTKELAGLNEALRKREAELATITANMAEGIYVLNQKGELTFMNPEAERLLGWTMDELNEKGGHNLVHNRKQDGSPLPFEECRMQMVLKTGERYFSTDEVFVRKDGVAFPISVISSPIFENGRAVASITAFQDITSLKRSEKAIRDLNRDLQRHASELEAAYKDMEGFSYAVSHDLKAPVIRIEGFTNIILEEYGDSLNENVREMLNRISRNTTDMRQLIEDLLAFFRYGSKKMEKTNVDIGALAMLIFQELRADTAGRKIRFGIKDPPPGYCDPALMRQVLLNLISNAIKFTRTKEEAVIEFGGYPEKEQNVYFVRDNGIGFDPQFTRKLFGLFQRIHTLKQFEGTGVGLVIVKKIIENHNGKVWAEGRPKEGASFFFTLPRDEYTRLSLSAR